MHIITTCKYEKDRMKNSREKLATSILRRSRAGNCGPGLDLAEFRTHPSSYVWHRFCKYEKDPIKTAEKTWRHRFHHYKSMEIFSNARDTVFPIISLWRFFPRSRAANTVVCVRIWPNFELIQNLMYVIVTCKYEKDPIKNSRENLATRFPP